MWRHVIRAPLWATSRIDGGPSRPTAMSLPFWCLQAELHWGENGDLASVFYMWPSSFLSTICWRGCLLQVGEPTPASRPQGSCYMKACFPRPAAAAVAPGSLHLQAGPRVPAPSGLGPLCLQQLPWLQVAWASKQATGLLLPIDFILPWHQQLLWLLEAGTWQAGHSTPTVHRLGSSMSAEAAMAPGSLY
jgi:hypothetical protein